MFTVALVGRPNVGKSTLFNRLVGKKIAIVDDQPGVTRDRKSSVASLGDLTFNLIDSAGLEKDSEYFLSDKMWSQTEKAVEEADVCLLMFDARLGLVAEDNSLSKWLRKKGKPIIVLANKSEGSHGEQAVADAYSLGFDTVLPVSAEHGEGMSELYQALLPFEKEGETAEEEGEETKPLQLAIVGRPNVGKSTLINTLIGQERLLTGDEPGVTRDTIKVPYQFKGRPIQLVDTAGLRKKSKVVERLEKLSTKETRHAIEYAEVVILLVDATQALEKQDLTVASNVVEEGRALLIGLNKWDLVEDPAKTLKEIREKLEITLSQVKDITFVPVSGLHNKNLDKLLTAVFKAYDVWNKRIPTPELNKWLAHTIDRHPPPLAKGRRLKFRYMSQIKNRPPTFALFVSQIAEAPDSYIRYLTNTLRESFKLDGVPIRIYLRQGDNPYDTKKKGKS